MKASPRYLTKSRFKLAVDCPTKLFYYGKGNTYRDAMGESDFLAMLAEGGYQVGALAKLRFPGGIEIEGLNHAAAEAQTVELLRRDNVVLFEPAIRVGDFFIRIDILVKSGERFELIEVKAKSYNSREPGIEGRRGGISSGMLPYIQDAAFQTWVLRQAFPDAEITTALMMPDKAQLAPLDGINQMFKINERSDVELRIPPGVDRKALAETLLAKVCVDSYVAQVLRQPLDFPGGPAMLDDAAKSWVEAYRNDRRIAPVIGAQCGDCQFKADPGNTLKSGFHECWKAANGWNDQDFAGGTVLDLWNFRGKQKLIDQGVLKISQVTRDDLGEFDDESDTDGLSRKQRQWLQVGGIPADYDCGGYYFDRALAAVEMSRWRFPLHFIDFETSTVALPFYRDMRPYEPVAFQFSHHVMEADGSVWHDGQFLCVEPGEFPNYKFAQALKEALEGDEGSVFMWSHHENTILSKIIEQLAANGHADNAADDNETRHARFPHPNPDGTTSHSTKPPSGQVAGYLPEGEGANEPLREFHVNGPNDPNRPEDAEALTAFFKRLVKGGDRAMVDLRVLAEKAFFHPDTKGSNSIKAVLPAILKVSDVLREKYSRPVYGAPDGIPSLNFSSPEGIAWIETAADRAASDPYAKLKQLAKDLISEEVMDAEGNASVIAEGGAAATAYARLQFEDIDGQTRERIRSALLRYCELDTLAMVMIVQAWRGMQIEGVA